MLVFGDLGSDCHSPWHILGQTNGDGNIFVDRLGDGFGNSHHSQDRGAVTASHEMPRHGHDRQIVRQAFQSRIATGPIDTIEKNVALSDRRNELMLIEARQEAAVVLGLQTQCLECKIEAPAEKLGDMDAFLIFDEGELAIVNGARDSGKHLIELRQIFEKRLAAPINDGG